MKNKLIILAFLLLPLLVNAQLNLKYVRSDDSTFAITNRSVPEDTLWKFTHDYVIRYESNVPTDTLGTLGISSSGANNEVQFSDGLSGFKSANDISAGSAFSWNGTDLYLQTATNDYFQFRKSFLQGYNNTTNGYLDIGLDYNDAFTWQNYSATGDYFDITARRPTVNWNSTDATHGNFSFIMGNRDLVGPDGGKIEFISSDAVNGNYVNLKIPTESNRYFDFNMKNNANLVDRFKLDTNSFTVQLNNTNVFKVSRDSAYINSNNVYYPNTTQVYQGPFESHVIRFDGIKGGDPADNYWFLKSAAPFTGPNIMPDYSDQNTGIGKGAPDELTIYAGGLVSLRAASDKVYVNNFQATGDATVNGQFSFLKGGNNYDMRFNESDGVYEVETGIMGVVNQIGLEDYVQGYNNLGFTIPNGTPLYTNLPLGDSIYTFGIASSKIPSTALRFVGLATSDIPNNSWGFATTRGKVRDYNTTTEGLIQAAPLYLGDSVLTNAKPPVNEEVIVVGSVIKTGIAGIINVDISAVLRRDIVGKDYNFTSQGIAAGTYYRGGFYRAPAADANLTQASPTVTYGTANVPYCAHPFVVLGGAGSAVGGVVGLRVTGNSIDDHGNLIVGDADTIITNITTGALNQYHEAKKFVGTVTFQLITISGTPTTYALDFNYGYAKYEDVENNDFWVRSVEVVGLAGASDASFNIELLHHKPTGWTYSATAFVPGDGAISSLSGDLSPYDDVSNGLPFAWKRTDLDYFVKGASNEGVIFRITTGANNTVQSMDLHIIGSID